MKHLKLFEEMTINWKEFPEQGHDLSTRESKIITDLVGDYLTKFEIKVDDHYYYANYGGNYNVFDDFNELKEYVLLWYYMYEVKPEEYLELLKTSKIDPSFNNNISIWWASKCGHTEIVRHLLNDTRVDPRRVSINHKEILKLLLNDLRFRSTLTEEEINKYTNEIS